MLATPHLLVGALIGKLTGNYWLALPVAFASHYLLDVIPHTDILAFKPRGVVTSGVVVFALADTVIGAFLVIQFSHGNAVMLAAAFTALLTDIIDNVPLWNRWLRRQSWYQWFFRLHSFFDGGSTISDSASKKVFGITTQAVLVFILILYFL